MNTKLVAINKKKISLPDKETILLKVNHPSSEDPAQK